VLVAIPGLSGRIFKNAAKTREIVLFQPVGAQDFQSPLAPFSARQALFRPLLVKTVKRNQERKSSQRLRSQTDIVNLDLFILS